ncbi:LMBR1 domain-containing protein 2 [Tritrichomonas musculus]|uniref:LMBR1 domain-containing protein 2 n=1 Tax=Tritrichomonas musculus TaxID=1915356 RepID=A0ABR2KKB4_9EUKA
MFSISTDYISPAAVCLLATIVLLTFFHYYGMFKFPWFVSSSLLVYALVVVFMTFGLLPYDISNSLFGPPNYDNHILKIVIQCLYWGTWILGWGLTPVFCCVYTYKYALTPCRRVWYSIRYNLVWYAIAFVIGSIFLIIYVATTGITWKNLVALGYAMCNAYGLTLVVFLLGHGLIALPRSIWNAGNPMNRVNFLFDSLNQSAKEVADATVNASYALKGLNKLSVHIPRFYEKLVRPNLQERISQLEELLLIKELPDHFYREITPNKKFKALADKNWDGATQYDIEDLFALVDWKIIALDEQKYAMNYYADMLTPAIKNMIKMKKNATFCFFKKFFCSLLSIFLFSLTASYVLGDITLIIEKPKYNLFHFLTRLKVPIFINQLCVTTPILGYLVFAGAWSCHLMKCGTMYRFIPHKSNDYTLYYWIVFMCRLCPSIAYNYINQIDAINTTVFEVYGEMREIAFLGNSYNKYLPCFMFIVMILVIFNVWDKILNLFGFQRTPDGSEKENEKRYMVYRELKPEDEHLLSDASFVSMMSNLSEQPLLY